MILNNQETEVILDGIPLDVRYRAEYDEPDIESYVEVSAVLIDGRNFIENLNEDAINEISQQVWDQIRGRS